MESKEELSKSSVTIATIHSASKRTSAIKILIYLNNNNDVLNMTEISNGLDMDFGTVTNNLFKLTEAGFLEKIEDQLDGRTRYFRIADKKAVATAIEFWENRERKMKKEGMTKPKVEPKPREVEEIE
jgi:DNA-binding MarR family transcriptional regulator